MPKKGRKSKQGVGEADAADAAEEEVTPQEKKRKIESAASSSNAKADLPEDAFLDDADDIDSSAEEEIDCENEDEEDENEGEDGAPSKLRVWRPGIDELQEGEQLDAEPGMYDMLHKAVVEWPCLSFDIVKDTLGAQRTTYPMTAYVVAGTQAANVDDNQIYMMKWHHLHRTAKDGCDESDEDEAESDSDDDQDGVLDYKGVPHPGVVNRIRAMPQAGHIVATWADTGKVHMWNLDSQKKALDKPGEKVVARPRPIFTCEAHKEEGYALDFNPAETGHFVTGSNDGAILLWEPVKGGWKVDAEKPFLGHTSSVEDVIWKRHGNGVKSTFASCSADKSIRVWDAREADRKKSAVHIAGAHEADVNTISWNPVVGDLLASGSDKGDFKVWDIRNVSAGPMANFYWHKKPITSLDWHPTDETTLVVSCEDDCVSLWDMAVEDDAEGRDEMAGVDHYPAQLMFLHQGQKEMKEVRWHPQLPGVCISTAASGFNIFKTCNI